MNERIRKLAEQSGFFPVSDETECDWEYRAENARYEKFAQLIVEECAQRAEAYAYMSANFTALAEELRRMVDVK